MKPAGGAQITIFAMDDQYSRFARLKSNSFDPATLWERLNGDVELLRELVGIFSEESPRMLEHIGTAIKHRAFADVQNFSHKLKGSALQFSGRKAAALAASLEKLGARKSLEGAEQIFSDLEQEVANLTRSLESMMEEHGDN